MLIDVGINLEEKNATFKNVRSEENFKLSPRFKINVTDAHEDTFPKINIKLGPLPQIQQSDPVKTKPKP
jgi:DNA-directed RNA polymerase subunit H (RpoH/RPB5)